MLWMLIKINCLAAHFYIVKPNSKGVYISFIFCSKINCVYSVEPPHKRVPKQFIKRENKSNSKQIQLELIHLQPITCAVYFIDVLSYCNIIFAIDME